MTPRPRRLRLAGLVFSRLPLAPILAGAPGSNELTGPKKEVDGATDPCANPPALLY
jgi:hypothetical protein